VRLSAWSAFQLGCGAEPPSETRELPRLDGELFGVEHCAGAMSYADFGVRWGGKRHTEAWRRDGDVSHGSGKLIKICGFSRTAVYYAVIAR
jgi:hypothetical protein